MIKPPASLLYCHWTASEKIPVRGTSAAAFQRNKGALYRRESHSSASSSAASCHSLGAFCQWFPYIEPRRSSAGWERCRSSWVPEFCRTKSLSCHLRLHAAPVITHITASTNKRHQSGTDAECIYSGRPFNWSDLRWKGIKSAADYSGWSNQTKLL